MLIILPAFLTIDQAATGLKTLEVKMAEENLILTEDQVYASESKKNDGLVCGGMRNGSSRISRLPTHDLTYSL